MLPKKGRMLHPWNGLAKSAKDYAELIAETLRREHDETHRTVKTVMRWTDASERSVKNWLSGESGPSGYFLMRLCVKSATIRTLVLELIVESGVPPSTSSAKVLDAMPTAADRLSAPEIEGSNGDTYGDIYGDIDVTINSTAPAPANPRQQWFLDRVARGERCTAEDIANHWQVALRTAKRDITLLRDNGRVRFEGSQRLGRYLILD